ncbi:nose resistant to fluoxetine protein 6-like [Ornithodoros turicata]|uniref:nose resistant to fluoxetine protein 6-like n=1 Tax=Ornithodoros turicata TaxID=34597 RepID=UPI0031389587
MWSLWHRLACLAALVLVIGVKCETGDLEPVEPDDEVTTLRPESTTLDFEEAFDDIMDQLSKRILPIASKIIGDENITSDCSRSILKLLLSLKSKAPWALRMADANGRPPPGLLFGTTGSYGDFDECVSVVAKPPNFVGKYCSLLLELPPKFAKSTAEIFQKDGYFVGRRSPEFFHAKRDGYYKGQRFGICMPSVCTIPDIERMMEMTIGKYGFSYFISGCDWVDNPDRNWTGIRIAMAAITGVLTLLVIAGTLLDWTVASDSPIRDKKSNWNYIMAYSAITNTRKLISTKIEEGSDNQRLSCFAGIKLFSTLWVILGHTYFIVDIGALRSYFKTVAATEEYLFPLIINAYPSISTFFFIAGFLVAFNILKRLKNYKGNFGVVVVVLILRRYIRLTLPVMFMVGFGFLLTMFIRGPTFFDFAGHNDNQCRQHWWRVALHINNWLPFLKMCNPFYWYISVDFQLYSVFWIIPVIMLKREKLGLFLMAALVAAPTIYVIVQTYIMDYQPLPLMLDVDERRPTETTDYVYVRPFTHVGSYCSGILFGYLVLKFAEVKIHKVLQGFLWVASFTAGLTVVMAAYPWMQNMFPSRIETALYAGLHRTAWALCMGWLTYACITGRGGFINRFLSWKAFIPLSRLSLGAYLTSIVLIQVRMVTRRELQEYTHPAMVTLFLAISVMSYIAAYVLFLLVECPINNLERKLLVSVGLEGKERKEQSNGHTICAGNGTSGGVPTVSDGVQLSVYTRKQMPV